MVKGTLNKARRQGTAWKHKENDTLFTARPNRRDGCVGAFLSTTWDFQQPPSTDHSAASRHIGPCSADGTPGVGDQRQSYQHHDAPHVLAVEELEVVAEQVEDEADQGRRQQQTRHSGVVGRPDHSDLPKHTGVGVANGQSATVDRSTAITANCHCRENYIMI